MCSPIGMYFNDHRSVVPTNGDGTEFYEPVDDVCQLQKSDPLLRGMACCHTLTYIKGNIVGDPLDIKMFDATTWVQK